MKGAAKKTTPAAKPAATKTSKAKDKGAAKKDWKSQHPHLFQKNARDFGIGRDILPKKRDLSRYVKWPRYVRIQRQRAILRQRLKVPPALNAFTKTVDKNQATNLFTLLSRYRPETAADKKARLLQQASAEAKDQDVKQKSKPKFIKYGLNHITRLIETKKAQLVIIAHDVEPVELVVWLPALCRKEDIPYCIVKGKARLGQLVHKKTAAALAITDVTKEDVPKLQQLTTNFRTMYNEATADRRRWGGGIMGHKAQAVIDQRKRLAAKEAAKSAALV
jgi:large subunit ribosomal protein L7Ae